MVVVCLITCLNVPETIESYVKIIIRLYTKDRFAFVLFNNVSRFQLRKVLPDYTSTLMRSLNGPRDGCEIPP